MVSRYCVKNLILPLQMKAYYFLLLLNTLKKIINWEHINTCHVICAYLFHFKSVMVILLFRKMIKCDRLVSLLKSELSPLVDAFIQISIKKYE